MDTYYRVDFHYLFPDGTSTLQSCAGHSGHHFSDEGLHAPDLPYGEKDYFFLFTEAGYNKFIDYFKELVAHPYFTVYDDDGDEPLAVQPVTNLHVQKVTSLAGCTVAYADALQIALEV